MDALPDYYYTRTQKGMGHSSQKAQGKWKWSRSVMSNSWQPHGLYLPGSSICGIFQASLLEVSQSCPTLGNPTDCTCRAPPSVGSSRQAYWRGLPSEVTLDNHSASALHVLERQEGCSRWLFKFQQPLYPTSWENWKLREFGTFLKSFSTKGWIWVCLITLVIPCTLPQSLGKAPIFLNYVGKCWYELSVWNFSYWIFNMK